MTRWRVWLLVFMGASGASNGAGAGAGVPPHMFASRADCMAVAQAADDWARPRCVLTTVVVKK